MGSQEKEPLKKAKRIGRNAMCPCQSGLKHKHCHGNERFRLLCQKAANEAANQMMLMCIQQMQAQKGICPGCKEKIVGNKCDACGIDFLTPEEAQARIDAEQRKEQSDLILPDKTIIVPENLKG